MSCQQNVVESCSIRNYVCCNPWLMKKDNVMELSCMALLNLTLTCNVIMCTVSLNYKIGFGTKQFQTIKSYQMYLIIQVYILEQEQMKMTQNIDVSPINYFFQRTNIRHVINQLLIMHNFQYRPWLCQIYLNVRNRVFENVQFSNYLSEKDRFRYI